MTLPLLLLHALHVSCTPQRSDSGEAAAGRPARRGRVNARALHHRRNKETTAQTKWTRQDISASSRLHGRHPRGGAEVRHHFRHVVARDELPDIRGYADMGWGYADRAVSQQEPLLTVAAAEQRGGEGLLRVYFFGFCGPRGCV